MNSDEGLPCVNTIEKVYLGLLVTVVALGIVSLFRLTYYKADLRKLFDPREGLTIIKTLVFVKIIFDFKNAYLRTPYKRLKWYGIETLEESEAKKLNVYGEDCTCEFNLADDFKCVCLWNKKITLKEHKSFQDLRIVSKLGIYGKLNMTFDRL